MLEERYERNETLRVIGIGAAMIAALLLGFAAIARADTGAAHAVTGSPDDLAAVLSTYGPVVGGMYLLYAVAAAVLARYAGSSWLAQGKRLAIATGLLGVAGAALQARLTGASWTVVLAAAVAAAFKLLTPTVTPVASAGAGPAKLASVAVLAIALGGMVINTSTGCGGSQSSRAATISAADGSLNSAAAALRAYEHEHTMSIIEHAPDRATGKAQVTAFRAKVDKVWAAVDAARAAVDSANTLNDDTSLNGAKAAIDAAIAAVIAITGGAL